MWTFIKPPTVEMLIKAHQDMEAMTRLRWLASERKDKMYGTKDSEAIVAADIDFWKAEKAEQKASSRYYTLRRRYRLANGFYE